MATVLQQFCPLAGIGEERTDLSIRTKDKPMPAGYIPMSLAAAGILEALPYLEEF